MQSEPPFKQLTKQNWCEPDPIINLFVAVEEADIRPISGDEWAELFLNGKLSHSVPKDIESMFDVARGALCYGYYFYPMFTLGTEQLHRVMDAALAHKCEGLVAPTRIDRFARRLKWLLGRDVFGERQFQRWDATRHLRNMGAHASRQNILSPAMAARILDTTRELINSLFET